MTKRIDRYQEELDRRSVHARDSFAFRQDNEIKFLRAVINDLGKHEESFDALWDDLVAMYTNRDPNEFKVYCNECGAELIGKEPHIPDCESGWRLDAVAAALELIRQHSQQL